MSPQEQALYDFAHSAGMDFILKQGENAIQQNYAARGALDSGAAMKALRDYGQNTAQANYFMPYMGLLGGQQATGAGAASSIAGVGSSFGNTAAGINSNLASGITGINNSMGGALQNGADNAAAAAAARGMAGANLGNGIATGLGQIAGSMIPYGSSYGGYGGGYGAYNDPYGMLGTDPIAGSIG
jgi:hypothetical protein